MMQAEPQLLARYAERQKWVAPVVSGPRRAAFGPERTGCLPFFRPRRVLRRYFRGMAKGYGVKKPVAGEDVLQLGGDFLLRDQKLLFAYHSADRPSVAALVRALPSAPPMADEPAPDATPR